MLSSHMIFDDTGKKTEMGTNRINILLSKINGMLFDGRMPYINLSRSKQGGGILTGTTSNRFFRISVIIFVFFNTLFGGSRLALIRPSAGMLEVRLANSESVGGIQFSLRTSSDLNLGAVTRSGLTRDSRWIVSSEKISDTVMNVVILGSTPGALTTGEGALVRIAYTASNPSAQSKASFADVMVANVHADSIAVELQGLTWTEIPAIADNTGAAKIFVLGQNYPNPFNPSTVIKYRLNTNALVHLSIYDVTGREVATLVDQFQSPGEYEVKWTNDSRNGARVASGLYFARLMVGKESQTRSLMMIK